MLPKPEKPLKKAVKSQEQLDLVKTIDEGKQIESRRKLVIFLLVASIGLSAIFSIYRITKKIIATKNYPSVSLPQVNFEKPDLVVTNTIESQINSIISNNPWSLKLYNLQDNNFNILWSLNPDKIDTDPQKIISSLSKSSLAPDSIVNQALPQGVVYHEKLNTASDFQEHQLLITLPKKQLLLLSRLNSSDFNTFKSQLPQIIDAVYWYAVKLKP